jgi:hypothetical protein
MPQPSQLAARTPSCSPPPSTHPTQRSPPLPLLTLSLQLVVTVTQGTSTNFECNRRGTCGEWGVRARRRGRARRGRPVVGRVCNGLVLVGLLPFPEGELPCAGVVGLG